MNEIQALPIIGDVTVKVIVAVIAPILVGCLAWLYKTRVRPFFGGVWLLTKDVAYIKKEFMTNSGSSLKDQIVGVLLDVGSIKNMLTLVEARQRGLIASMPRAMFETNDLFDWINANGAMERLTGVGMDRLSRRRWVSLIHEEDRDDVMQEIKHMVSDKRGATITFRFRVDEKDVPVLMDVAPIFASGSGDTVLCWSGSILPHADRRQEERRTL